MVVFKVIPFRYYTLRPTCFPIPQCFRRFNLYLFNGVQICPRSGFLGLENSQKPHRAKLGEYDGWGMIWVEFLTKVSRRINKEFECFWYQSTIDAFQAENLFTKFCWLIYLKCQRRQQGRESRMLIDGFWVPNLWIVWRDFLSIEFDDRPGHFHFQLIRSFLYTTRKHFFSTKTKISAKY